MLLCFVSSVQAVEAITYNPTITIPNPEVGEYPTQEFFGNSVGISGNTILIGEVGGRTVLLPDVPSGFAHLYDISGNLIKTINSPNPVDGGSFGRKVAIDGENALVADQMGGAYLFDTQGNFIRTLVSPEPDASIFLPRDISLSGNKALVSSPGIGAVYLFDITTGSNIQTFSNPNPGPGSTLTVGMTIDGNNVAIGAQLTNNQKLVYLFDASDGSVLQTFVDPNTGTATFFGYAVAISENKIAVGDPVNGLVYIFDITNGSLLTTIQAPDPSNIGDFGSRLDISGNYVVVGAPIARGPDEYDFEFGKAFLFDASDGSLIQELQSPHPSFNDEYGKAVAIDNGNVVIGSKNGPRAFVEGQAYLFVEDANSELTVKSEDEYGNPIAGYYTVLSQTGVILETGFTPATFLLNNDEPYTAQVQDYGNFAFKEWKLTGSTDRNRDISISTDTEIIAIYKNTSSPPGMSDITVHSLYGSTEITGYYTVLSQGGVIQETGFTIASFTVNNGETYNVGVQNFGNFVFDHWQDTGSTVANRNISLSTDTDLFAVYRNTTDPPPTGTSQLTVRTVNSSGDEITGYWTVLSHGGAVLQTGFSTDTFIVNNGENYEVSMGDYNGVTFDHWEDGSTDNPRTFSLTYDQTFTAYYLP